jgi:hypothetical protein
MLSAGLSWCRFLLCGAFLDAQRGQQFVEKRHGRTRVDGGAFLERFLPSGLESVHEFGAHPVGDVGVQAAHAGHLVAESLLGQDLRRAFLGQSPPDRHPTDRPADRQSAYGRAVIDTLPQRHILAPRSSFTQATTSAGRATILDLVDELLMNSANDFARIVDEAER